MAGFRLLLPLAAIALGAVPALAQAAVGDLVLVASPGNTAHHDVTDVRKRPAISADGRFVVYIAPLLSGSTLSLRDLQRGKTTRVFEASPVPAITPRWDAWYVTVSARGRYLAFSSNDPTISDEDAGGNHDGVNDVFVFDRLRRRYTLVSRRSGPRGVPGNSNTTYSSISYDGSRVAYYSNSDNLVPTRPITIDGVFTRDLQTERNEVVSAERGIQFWRPDSLGGTISGDGDRVAYLYEYGLPAYDPDHPPPHPERWYLRRRKQVLLTDPEWRAPRVVSRAAGRRGALANDNCREVAVSATGRFVAFTSEASNLAPGDRNGAEDVFVRDVARGWTTLVSQVGHGGRIGNGDSGQPSISGDGRYVAFTTEASNLVSSDPDEEPDVIVKDLRTGRLLPVSRGFGNEPSDGRSAGPAISADGRFVAFDSNATNLTRRAPHPLYSVYRFQLLP